MLGITIRKNAARNDLTTPDGKVFSLEGKGGHLAAALMQQYLENVGFFKRTDVLTKK